MYHIIDSPSHPYSVASEIFKYARFPRFHLKSLCDLFPSNYSHDQGLVQKVCFPRSTSSFNDLSTILLLNGAADAKAPITSGSQHHYHPGTHRGRCWYASTVVLPVPIAHILPSPAVKRWDDGSGAVIDSAIKGDGPEQLQVAHGPCRPFPLFPSPCPSRSIAPTSNAKRCKNQPRQRAPPMPPRRSRAV